MLAACHDRVRRSLTLLDKLIDHIGRHGHDAQSRSAAADVLRYFDLAAPLHHEDEELNVFPVLLAQPDAAMQAVVASLRRDHQQMSALWAAVREPLGRWRRLDASGGIDEQTRSTVASFRAIYATHLEAEEGVAFPAARALMDPAAQRAIGRQMQARRHA